MNTISSSSSIKIAAQVALGFLIALLIGSIIFWKERMLFSDAAFISFRIINYGTLQIQVDRYGAFITQLFHYLASKAHLPLASVLLWYSISFNLFYLVVGGLLYRLRQYSLTILLAFYLSLYVSDTYFWTNNEVHQGIAWMLLNFGLLQYWYQRNEHHSKRFLLFALPVFTILTFISIYTHPLVMIVFGFLWVFFVFAQQPFYRSRISWLFITIIILIAVVKFLDSQNNWYDGGLLHNITHTTLRAVLKTFTSSLAQDFIQGGWNNYWLLWLLFFSGSIALWLQKKFLLFTLTLFSCLAYFILICLTFYPSKPFYIESEWMSISFMGTVGFVYYVLPKMSNKLVVLLMITVFTIRLGFICNSANLFKERIQFLETTLDGMRQKKVTKLIVVNDHNQLEDKLLLTWGLPYETLMLSAMKRDTPNRTMSYLLKEKINEANALQTKDALMTAFGPFNHQNINSYYFQLDTTTFYKVQELNN